MATNNYFKGNITNHHALRRRHSIDCPRSTVSSNSFLVKKPNNSNTKNKNNPFLSRFITCNSLSSTTSTTPTTPSTTDPNAISYDLLEQLLSSKNFRQADDETRRLLIVLAGEGAQKRGYVFFSEVQFIPEDDLKTIDTLWKKYSDNKFGYSVQKKIFKKVNKDFSRLFIKLGWMKKLDSEVEQYNYRAFPTEFIWELNDETPEGHLPLTNALRGTQLMTCILKHPAFDNEDEVSGEGNDGKLESVTSGSKPFSKNNLFKTDYSF
ncbi:hypothetical protein Leryth_006317 [Lithospermum erythrorhizon]|uniref:GUN4-like domain-containing protein n=1 Tax=Lithospermum erythrorhizon TaxID=34254 RepID=A0AAV3QFX0_LITER|nr:hypothetical protein Leryth_006317 [Lithospermum erythrorhizon]